MILRNHDTPDKVMETDLPPTLESEAVDKVKQLYESGARSAIVSRNVADALKRDVPLSFVPNDPLSQMRINIAPRFFPDNFVMRGN